MNQNTNTTQCTRCEALRDSMSERLAKLEQEITAWRTRPASDKKEKSIHEVLNAYYFEECQLQEAEIARIVDSLERYDASQNAVAY